MAAAETNRATVVALHAEVRRIKGRLMDELPKLQKLAQKRVGCFLFLDNILFFAYSEFFFCVILSYINQATVKLNKKGNKKYLTRNIFGLDI